MMNGLQGAVRQFGHQNTDLFYSQHYHIATSQHHRIATSTHHNNIMKKITSFICLLAILASCNNTPNQNQTPPASTNTNNTTDTTNTQSGNTITVKALIIIDQIMGNLRPWVEFYQHKNSAFDVGNLAFTATQKSKLMTSSFGMSKDFNEQYGKWLIPSPNKQRVLDLYSYNLVIERDKLGKWNCKGLNSDSEVSVIDPSTKTKTRLLFMGPGTTIENGFWLDDNNVVIVGIGINNQYNAPNPILWQINLITQEIDQFDYLDNLKIPTLDSYLKEQRFKGLRCF